MIEKIRKWVKDKTGVSPIIAIILMVAITVVLAATIYVWVSGMGGGGATKIALNMKQTDYDATKHNVTYEILSVSGGPGWEDIKITVNGNLAFDKGYVQSGYTIWINGNKYTSTSSQVTGAISAGDEIVINHATNVAAGNTVSIIDADSGQVLWSAEIHY